MSAKVRSVFPFVLVIALSAPAWAQGEVRQADAVLLNVEGGGYAEVDEPATLYISTPHTFTVAEFGAEIESANITDLEVADFDGDGRNDLAVAWYVTDLDDMDNNLRFLTVYLGAGTNGFTRAADIDLYVPNHMIEALSVFRNGPADIGVGDFDGDGDPDLAVTPFFGDELWFVENLGAGTFAQHLKYPFGFNSTGNFQTPPEALAADFDGDGRDELVYIADPIQYIQGDQIHFWTTDGAIADMHLTGWEGIADEFVQWTRGLAVGDFNADGLPDLCFSGSIHPPYEDDPVLVFWYDLNLITGRFKVHTEYPNFLCSDVVAVQPDPSCPPGVLVTGLDGTRIEYWAHECSLPSFSFYRAAGAEHYAGYAADRGMTAVTADVDGDGDVDLVTRQKLGEFTSRRQVEITLCSAQGLEWTRVRPAPVSSFGFQDLPYSEILRPRNLAVADLFGNTLPEIVAGFGPGPAGSLSCDGASVLRVACWANSCLGDITRDGYTDMADVSAVIADFKQPVPPANPDADINKDGWVDLVDLSTVMANYGCDCFHQSVPPEPL